MPRYFNKKTTFDGYDFDSRRELERYKELKLLEQGGVISDLTVHPTFTLIPGFHSVAENKSGKKKWRPTTYTPDFMYIERGNQVIEDVKSSNGYKQDVFKIKMKLFCKKYPELIFRIT